VQQWIDLVTVLTTQAGLETVEGTLKRRHSGNDGPESEPTRMEQSKVQESVVYFYVAFIATRPRVRPSSARPRD
jgi:hypothetical protein